MFRILIATNPWTWATDTHAKGSPHQHPKTSSVTWSSESHSSFKFFNKQIGLPGTQIEK